MQIRNPALETRLAESLMFALFPCDLGDGIEVVHDVEHIEIELDCDVGEDGWYSAPYERIEIEFEASAHSQYTPCMCLICIDLAKQKITPAEARRALREMTEKLDREHVREVETKVAEAEAATKP